MLYALYQTAADVMLPMRIWAAVAGQGFALGGEASADRWRAASALCEMMSRAALSHRRPPFGIDAVKCGNQLVPVREEEALATPFGTLLRFGKEGVGPQPRVLLVAPLSGHFATLLRDTVRVLLPEHDVYVTDWANARDIAVWNGRFGFDEYIDHLILFLEAMGPGAHVVAVCQPCVQALAAAAIMAEDDNPAQPRSMTLMAGPIDTRVNPTKVNDTATGKPIRRTALFTVEGERDDICSIGQTVAAHDLCSSLRPYRKKHYMQAGVGHYGVFSGRRWAGQIYPLVRNTILSNE